MLTACADGTVTTFDAVSGAVRYRGAYHAGRITGIGFSSPSLVVTAGWDRTLRIHDTRTGHLLHDLRVNDRPDVLAADAVHGIVVTGYESGLVEARSATDGRTLARWTAPSAITAIAMTPPASDRPLLVAGDAMGVSHLLELRVSASARERRG